MKETFDTVEDYKKHKQEKHHEMLMKQNIPYKIKVRMAQDRIRSFIAECDKRDRALDKPKKRR